MRDAFLDGPQDGVVRSTILALPSASLTEDDENHAECEHKPRHAEGPFFAHLLEAVGDHAPNAGTTSAKRTRLSLRIREAAARAGSGTARLFSNETQRYNENKYEWPRDVHDALDRQQIKLFTFLVGHTSHQLPDRNRMSGCEVMQHCLPVLAQGRRIVEMMWMNQVELQRRRPAPRMPETGCLPAQPQSTPRNATRRKISRHRACGSKSRRAVMDSRLEYTGAARSMRARENPIRGGAADPARAARTESAGGRSLIRTNHVGARRMDGCW
nr:hypothetical protein [Burkholderia sp. BCC1998]